MEKCQNCWTRKMDCRTCPYRVREVAKPVNTSNIKQDLAGLILIVVVVLVLIAL